MKLKLVCETCRHYNRSYMGTPGYEFRDYEFTFLSDLLNHWHQNTSHHVDIEIESDNEGEQE